VNALPRAIPLLCLIAMASACKGGDSGDRFDVGVAGYDSRPKLVEAHLLGGEDGDARRVTVNDWAGHYLILPKDHLPVPETLKFSWRASGDTGLKHAKFALRSALPADVLRRIKGGFTPQHTLSLTFLVIDGAPKCRWRLDNTDYDMRPVTKERIADINSNLVAEGVVSGVLQ
jgi:hypothetical protein